jgi:outer membrane protein TolC
VLSGLTNVVTLHQLIFDFNHTRDTVRQADAEEKAAKQGLTLAQLTLVYDVKQAYYTYVQDEELVKVQEANVKDTTQELDQATASLKVGLGAPADVVTATTNLGNATSALSQAQQTALIARINLALAIGIDARTPIVTSDAQEAVPPSTDVNALVIQALKARPDILQAQQTLRAAGFEFDAAKTVSAPSVDLSISGATRSNDQFFSENAGSLGLSLTWNFLDGGVTAGTKKEAQADIKTALANYQLAQQTAVSDVAQAYTNLVGAEQRVKISQAAVANAETGLKLAEGQFKAGVTIFVTVTTAETNLVQAQTDLVTAQVSVQLARAQLRHAIGAQ